MRVVGGEKRGTLLSTFENENIRPTLDHVKEALFSIIQFEPFDAFLDLFSGTGQIGIEAISRGAKHVVMCDNSPDSVSLIRRNLAKTKLTDRATVLLTDYKRFLKQTDLKFHVVFLDPPFGAIAGDKALELLGEGRILHPDGLVLFECDASAVKPETVGCLTLRKRYRYGQVALFLYQKVGDCV